MKKWNGSRVEAEGQMARSKRGASPSRNGGITSKRRSQLPFCLAPSMVALILALACVARLAEIAADIGTALRALAWVLPSIAYQRRREQTGRRTNGENDEARMV